MKEIFNSNTFKRKTYQIQITKLEPKIIVCEGTCLMIYIGKAEVSVHNLSVLVEIV